MNKRGTSYTNHQEKAKLVLNNLMNFKADKYYLSEMEQHSIAVDYSKNKICILDRWQQVFVSDFNQLLQVELRVNYETVQKRSINTKWGKTKLKAILDTAKLEIQNDIFDDNIVKKSIQRTELKIILNLNYSQENLFNEINQIGFVEQEKGNKTPNNETAKKWFRLLSNIIEEQEKKRFKNAESSLSSGDNFISVLPNKNLNQSSDLEKAKNKMTEQKKWENLVEKGIIKDETLSKLKITVDNIESSFLKDDKPVFIINIKFDNLTSKSKKIEVSEAQYVSQNKEQIEQDFWLTGQLFKKGILKPNSFRKAGLIFYKTKLVKICENDLLYLTIGLPKEGKEFAFCFQNKNNEWNLQKAETKEIEIKLTSKQREKNILKKVERFEAFEERIGVSFEKISMKVEENGWFYLFFEVHSNEGANLKETVRIECVLYDKNGLILEKESSIILGGDFFGFELIKMSFQENNLASKVGKIRLYPKK